MTSYSFSLDRQVWTGRFSSRKQAAEAAIAHAIQQATPPETVYVGQRVDPDLRAYGHAQALVDTIRRRVREDNGDTAEGFLAQVSPKQIADLDRALEATIIDWLKRHDLDPKWARIEAVGEYPIPASVHTI
jgi:hypothetical protein